MPDDKDERKHVHLHIKSIGTPKPVGSTQVTEFIVEEDTLKYEFWGNQFAQYIQPKSQIDVDIVDQRREVNGNLYQHHKVTQLYINGQPIATTKQGAGGYRPQGKSLEEIKSIENQTRAHVIAELWTTEKIKAEDQEVQALRKWLLAF